MRPLSNDLREFIHLLNTKSVKYVIVGAWALAFHGRPPQGQSRVGGVTKGRCEA
jgi:hypothetical protein